jgi:hypothetical protein
MPINTKAALREAVLLLIDIDRSIGCSLKIHRVEISVAGGKRFQSHRAVSNILIASKRMKLCFIQVMTNLSLTAMSKNHSHYGITREVKDLASP